MRTEGRGRWEDGYHCMLTEEMGDSRADLSRQFLCALGSPERPHCIALLGFYHEPTQLGLLSFRETHGRGSS